MDIEKLKKQLILDEGLKEYIYIDTEGNPTFGIGHLLTKKDPEWYAFKSLKKGGKLKVSKERIFAAFDDDVEQAIQSCYKIFDEFDDFLDEVQQIITNMMFNLGINRFKKFEAFIASIYDKNYKLAAREMKDSLWYVQTKDRAKRLVARMEKVANNSLCNV